MSSVLLVKHFSLRSLIVTFRSSSIRRIIIRKIIIRIFIIRFIHLLNILIYFPFIHAPNSIIFQFIANFWKTTLNCRTLAASKGNFNRSLFIFFYREFGAVFVKTVRSFRENTTAFPILTIITCFFSCKTSFKITTNHSHFKISNYKFQI